jgi:hypothetical protein
MLPGKLLPCCAFPITKERREALNRPQRKFSGSKTDELLALFEWHGFMATNK